MTLALRIARPHLLTLVYTTNNLIYHCANLPYTSNPPLLEITLHSPHQPLAHPMVNPCT